MLTIASTRLSKAWSIDITEVLIQVKNLTLPLYFITLPEFGLKPDEVFQLLKALYDLSNDGDY